MNITGETRSVVSETQKQTSFASVTERDPP